MIEFKKIVFAFRNCTWFPQFEIFRESLPHHFVLLPYQKRFEKRKQIWRRAGLSELKFDETLTVEKIKRFCADRREILLAELSQSIGTECLLDYLPKIPVLKPDLIQVREPHRDIESRCCAICILFAKYQCGRCRKLFYCSRVCQKKRLEDAQKSL